MSGLPATVAEAGRRFGDAPAYVAADGEPLSYADLDRRSDAAAVGLLQDGVGEGDVVALLLPSSPAYVIAYVAAAKVGAITAGVNQRLSEPEQRAVLDVAQPKLVVSEPLPEVKGETPPVLPDDPERPVAIVFTSGTTGLPKGAVYAARQLAFIASIETGGQWGTGGRGLAGTSFAHLGFMSKLEGVLMRGGTTYLMERWTAAGALRMAVERKLTGMGGIPTQLALMMREPGFDDADLSSLRSIVMGGGPATPALVQEIRRRFKVPVLTRYSCTEAGLGTGTMPDDPPEDAEISVGRPQRGVELLFDGDEVCFRSPATMSGYWGAGGRGPLGVPAGVSAGRRPERTNVIVHTGDVGWVDDQGRLRLSGRATEMFVRGGYNVHPQEVETVLAEHPSVASVAVVPRPDDVMGEVGVAVVVVRHGQPQPTLDDLRAFGRDRLAAYKLPEDILIVEGLPLTAMEKVDRRALVAAVSKVRPS
jgi:acyl-CoA synthetase (AMP-forming)/AMP-acid ligase II